jgi:hypothetical protein
MIHNKHMSRSTYPKRAGQLKVWRQRRRKVILDLLGGVYVFCGFDDPRALQCDHIKGGGMQDRRSASGNYEGLVLRSIMAGENKFQLLCANCNWIKRAERGEVRNGKNN